MRNTKVMNLTQGAMIAACYVVLCLVFEPISYGGVQVRIAEALAILPLFTPAAIPGLFIGCIIANVIGGGIVLDVVFGSIATLIWAVGTYMLRNRTRWLAPVPPILANTIIVPFVIFYGYGTPIPIPLLMLTIGAGEVIGCGILGLLLAKGLERMPAGIFRAQAR